MDLLNLDFPGLPGARLCFYKFKCQDIKRTMEFYQSLGMTVDYLFERDGRTHLALEFRSASTVLNEYSAKLVFEYRPDDRPVPKPPIVEKDAMGRIRPVAEPLPDHNHEYLVVYVKMLDRLVKRVEGRGFKLRCPVVEYSGVRFGVATDPNGIDVRLIQLTDVQMNEPSNVRNQWFGRIAYYTLPTAKGEATIRYYEKLFSSTVDASILATNPKQKPNAKNNGNGNDPKTDTKPSSAGNWDVDMDVMRPGMWNKGRGGQKKRTGFRLVDTEDFFVGLTHTVFWWMANGPRELSCGVCFSQKTELEAACATPMGCRVRSNFMGLGFEVPDLEVAMKRLEDEYPDPIDFIEQNVVVPNLGTTTIMKDPYNNFSISIVQLTPLRTAKSLDVALSTLASTTTKSTTASTQSLSSDTKPKKRHSTKTPATTLTSTQDLATSQTTLTTPSGHQYPLSTPAPRQMRLMRLKTPGGVQMSQTPPTAPPKRNNKGGRKGRVVRPRTRAATREVVSRAAEPGVGGIVGMKRVMSAEW